MLAGQLMAGGCVSLTVTVKLQLSLLPWISLTVTSTVAVPTGKVCGEVMVVAPILYTVLATPQLSVGVATKATLAEHSLASLGATMLAGQLGLGFSVSLTVTLKLQSVWLPAASVTRKVLMVVPTGKVAPLARPAVCAAVAPGQLSVPTGAV